MLDLIPISIFISILSVVNLINRQPHSRHLLLINFSSRNIPLVSLFLSLFCSINYNHNTEVHKKINFGVLGGGGWIDMNPPKNLANKISCLLPGS